MATSMNIKNEETTRLAHELAELTGESLTTAITAAVRERLDRIRQQRQAKYERLLAIADDFAAHLTKEERSFDYDAWLYDENGLPH